MKIYFYKRLKSQAPRFLTSFFSLWHHGGCQRPFPFLWCELYLTTISVEPKILAEFVPLKLKVCSLYHENLFIQKVKVISTHLLSIWTAIIGIFDILQFEISSWIFSLVWIGKKIQFEILISWPKFVIPAVRTFTWCW